MESERKMATHTPGPWFTLHDDGVVMTKEKTGDNTARYVTICRAESNGCANARRIVHAVNNFDALYEALARLSNEVLGSLPLIEPFARQQFGNTNYNALIQRANEARAALTSARQE